MSFLRAAFPASFVSLLAAAFLFIPCLKMGHEVYRGGYAVLTSDVSADDKLIHSLLDNQEFLNGSPVSESSQWVMLDVFDRLQTVPLDEYFSRIFTFDPRYDNYAEKLKNIFIKDDKRFVYLPLLENNWNPAALDKQIGSLLGNIPFSVNYYGIGRPLDLFFLTFAVSSFIFFVICIILNKSRQGFLKIFFLVPVLSSLVFFGACGIACAALILAFFILLREPLTEILTLSRSPTDRNVSLFTLIVKRAVLPYRLSWFLSLAFFPAAAVIVYFSHINILFLLAAFFAAAAVFIITIKLFSYSGWKRKRFVPVMIMRKSFTDFSFSVCIMPFTAAAFFTLFFAPALPDFYTSTDRFESVINENEYYDHLITQAAFSTQKIGTARDGIPSGVFPDFSTGEDGLPVMNTLYASQKYNIDEFPPFPLKDLMEFFHDINSRQVTNPGSGGTGNPAEKFSLLVLLPFLLMIFFIKRKNDESVKYDFSSFKRISGKMRFKGINLNKPISYNAENTPRLRKDA